MLPVPVCGRWSRNGGISACWNERENFCFLCSYPFSCCIWECYSPFFFLYSAMIVWRNLFKGTVGKQSQFLTCIFVTPFMIKGWAFRPYSDHAVQLETKPQKRCLFSHGAANTALHTLCSLASALEQMWDESGACSSCRGGEGYLQATELVCMKTPAITLIFLFKIKQRAADVFYCTLRAVVFDLIRKLWE